jgi:hypothetical protein
LPAHAGDLPCSVGIVASTSVEYDDAQRQTAVQVERDHPRWVIVWGSYSREFWAYPKFNVPPGTVLHSRDPNVVATQMRQVELQHGRAGSGKP